MAAQLGQPLPAPEPGWKRYDDKEPAFKYTGTWTTISNASYYKSAGIYGGNNTKIRFSFIGTKLRIIGYHDTSRSNNIQISVDGVIETFSQQIESGQVYQALSYEKVGLTNSRHEVEITNLGAGNFNFDAIDIDDTGRLLHPDEVLDIKDLAVGKRIRCHYQASSGQVGVFSGLGQETSDFILPTSSATPNDDFYFICVDEDHLGRWMLVADRNIQHSISWDTLNTAGIASGSGLPIKIYTGIGNQIPIMTSNTTPSGIASGSSIWNTGWDFYKAFDGDLATDWHPASGSTYPHWLSYEFTSPKVITDYAILPRDNTYAPKDWTFEGWDGSKWVVLDTRTNETSWITGQKRYFHFNNLVSYIKYRINVTAGNGQQYVAIKALEMFEEQKISSLNFAIRLMTGGIYSNDKDNEWDKYIVNSTLNGTITAGDNAVWNWSGIRSWTSTTVNGQSSARAGRGSVSVSDYNYASTSFVTTAYGFRPVLLIELQPPKFEGSVDKTTIHNEDVVLTGIISDPSNGLVQYRILVNGIQEYPTNGYTDLLPSPLSINYTIMNNKLRLGNNQINIEIINSDGVFGIWSTTVNLNSQAPIITANMTGMRLDVNIDDPETDLIRFRVEFNGQQIYPIDTTQQFTDLSSPVVTYQKLFRSNEVIIGESNNVTIVAQDKFGAESIVTLNFVGEYTGLMFADEQGSYYSTDLGEILKYLDVGTLIAGQTSFEYKINLINKLPFSVKSIHLWSEHNIDMDVEFSKTNNPFIAESSLTYNQIFNYNDVISFYVRLKTNSSAQHGGNFDIKVSAEQA